MSGIDGLDELRKLTDSATYSRLRKDLSAVKNDVSALAEQITDALNTFTGQASKQARRGVSQARSNAQSMLSDAQDRGSELYDRAYDTASSLEESFEDAVSQRPLVSVGLALGLGVLIGMSLRR